MAGCLAPAPTEADGFFVAPFVWNKKQDINEPSQKAIILYDAHREDLILQVKYEGPVKEFGWLIPVPSLPTVTKASMNCFYDLSRFTQEYMASSGGVLKMAFASLSAREEPVKVIEVKTVGAYKIAVLSPKDAGSLQHWLDTNHFSYPADKSEVLDSYISHGWYFVAVKINLGDAGSLPRPSGKNEMARADSSIPEKLASGELHPLQISFDSDRCIFPLKISSVNGQDAEVHIYVLSSEPLIEKGLFDRELRAAGREQMEAAQRFNDNAHKLNEARQRIQSPLVGEFDPPQIARALMSAEEPIGSFWKGATGYHRHQQVSKKEIPSCARQLDRMGTRKWWLDKYSMKFQAPDMRDLVFEPALTVLSDKLADEEGYIAAVNLGQFKSEAEPLVLAALNSSNAFVRENAAFAILRDDSGMANNERLLRALAARFDDPDARVRVAAVRAAANSGDGSLFKPIIQLGRDEDRSVRAAAVEAVMTHRNLASSHVPQIQDMVKDDDLEIVVAGLQMLSSLDAKIPRQDLPPLFKLPNRDILLLSWQCCRTEPFSCEEAGPLLENPVMIGRVFGLNILHKADTRQSVEMMLPLLRDREKYVRDRTYKDLCALTGKSEIPQDKPEQWEEWWEANKSSFTPVERPRSRAGPPSGMQR